MTISIPIWMKGKFDIKIRVAMWMKAKVDIKIYTVENFKGYIFRWYSEVENVT